MKQILRDVYYRMIMWLNYQYHDWESRKPTRADRKPLWICREWARLNTN